NRKSSASSPSRAITIRFFRFSLSSARKVSSTSCGSSSTRRISIASSVMVASRGGNLRFPGRCFGAQAEIESSAFIHLGLRPDAAAVLVNDTLHHGQSHTGPFEILTAMQALKDAEQLVRIFHIEAYFDIADKNNPPGR